MIQKSKLYAKQFTSESALRRAEKSSFIIFLKTAFRVADLDLLKTITTASLHNRGGWTRSCADTVSVVRTLPTLPRK